MSLILAAVPAVLDLDPNPCDDILTGQVSVRYKDSAGVVIERPGKKPVYYSQSGRSLFQVSREWPPDWSDPKKLIAQGPFLDAFCGQGKLVIELSDKLEVDAAGFDLALPEELQDDPRFHKVDALKTGLPSDKYGTILISYGMFTFENDLDLYAGVLREMYRIAKLEGVVRIGPVFHEETFRNAMKRVPGLRLNNPLEGRSYLPSWVELKKVDVPG